jgi:hypothetical protein
MKVKEFKKMLDTLDPEAHLFINETYNQPFRKTKAEIKIPAKFCAVGKLGRAGDFTKEKIEKCAYFQIENWSSDEAVSNL